jgi:membrane protease YdiL (CAAX protease family)
MDATTRGRAGVNRDPAADLTAKVTETAQQFISGGKNRSYMDERRARLRRRRFVGLSVFVPLWVLSLIPLARHSMDGREGTDAVLVYLVVGALSLGIAALIRGAYIVVTKHHFWSPWVFVLAVGLALCGYSVQSAGPEPIPLESAPAAADRGPVA